MSARVHLVTLAGGHLDVLEAMLEHYRGLGIESFLVNLHLKREDDPLRETAEAIVRRAGCRLHSVIVGDWQFHQQAVYTAAREEHPDDWFLLADQDELQAWPDAPSRVLAECERRGADYVRGCFVDRLARDGSLGAVRAGISIWDLFPLGAWLTVPLLGGDPRKVVAAKGWVRVAKGQHYALDGTPAALRDLFVQVHHFKWTAGLVERLERRAAELRSGGWGQWIDSARAVQYLRAHDMRFPLDEPEFRIAECGMDYPRWDELRTLLRFLPDPRR